MIDPNRAHVLGAPKQPVVQVKHPQTGETYDIPQVAVAMLADNITQALVNTIAQYVTMNVVANVLRAFKDRCHFPISASTICGVTRVVHNVPKHDFVEPPPPPQEQPAPEPTAQADPTNDAGEPAADGIADDAVAHDVVEHDGAQS